MPSAKINEIQSNHKINFATFLPPSCTLFEI